MSSIPNIQSQRYTVADYLTWPDEERWELIDGVAYDMSPAPTIKHQNIAGRLYSRLEQKLRGKSCQPFIAPVDVVLSERDVVLPDVTVVCDPGKITEKYIQGAPDLVVEVLSPFTATKDLREKKALYERAGVSEYLLIDPLEEYAQAFRLRDEGRFGAADIYGPDEVLPLQSLTDLEIPLWEVLGLPEPGSQPSADRPHP
jgi:Uma2 family endonuclease